MIEAPFLWTFLESCSWLIWGLVVHIFAYHPCSNIPGQVETFTAWSFCFSLLSLTSPKLLQFNYQTKTELNAPSLGLSPLPVTVTTRIITFLIGYPYKPSFATITGRGGCPPKPSSKKQKNNSILPTFTTRLKPACKLPRKHSKASVDSSWPPKASSKVRPPALNLRHRWPYP